MLTERRETKRTSRNSGLQCKFTGDTIAGGCRDYYHPRLGLYEESLVPVGRTVEEIVFSTPATRAWSDVLKWLPARTVSELSLVCREWRAMVTTNRFIRSHGVHANLIAKHPRIKLVRDLFGGKFADIDDLIISGDSPTVFESTSFICSQPCHGLNLGRYLSWHLVLNPCTGYKVELPYNGWGRVALGYDAATGRHVVVCLAYAKRNLETRCYELLSQIMLVGGDNEWERAEPPPRPVADDVPPAYAKGKIYWMVDSRLGAPPSSAAAAF
ncbi:hypothetical protein E2562_030895 [Oryza meyeriana var. granulata]|uniref:F-box domain-containing protein n=1 Tax=Oryza meyeriana var. granulata TaxID=110450 RepID=A0A6G1F094_9ORYZ|nr:hypothetical protein E2562_030895 [Oryza meyeriana var. granulata]